MKNRRTYVLVHGAWHGAWCWARVAEPLRAAGHRVLTPTQTGLGERRHLISKQITLDTFIRDIVNVLEFDNVQDAVLVGHSFGGISISGAADQVPQRIRHLVYLDSLLLENGQSPFSRVPAEVAAARRKLAQDTSGGLSIPVPDPVAFGVQDPADAEWLRTYCTPHPLSTYEDTLKLSAPIGNGLPATYIAVKPDYGPTASSRAFAKSRPQWRYMEMEAGHDAMVTSPAALTEILLGI